jgi:ribosomal protein L18E
MGFAQEERVAIWKAVLEVYSNPRREDVAIVVQSFQSA